MFNADNYSSSNTLQGFKTQERSEPQIKISCFL